MMDIKYSGVNTHNERGDRFVLTIDEDNSVTVYDNHKRDGFGLVCGNECKGFMGSGGRISKTNFIYFADMLNSLYRENQALKNGNEYHKLVLEKMDKIIGEYEFLFRETMGDKDLGLHKFYGCVLDELNGVRDELQGEGYE